VFEAFVASFTVQLALYADGLRFSVLYTQKYSQVSNLRLNYVMQFVRGEE